MYCSFEFFIPPFPEVSNLMSTGAMKEFTKRGFLKTFRSFSVLGFGQGLVFQLSSSDKNLGRFQRLSMSDDTSLTKPVSSMIDEKIEDFEIEDICQKHTRKYSIESNYSITSMCSFQSFSDSIESLTSSTELNQRNDETEYYSAGMSNFVKVECPPGGENSIILYTTSLTGIRKTFEDCNIIRFLLQSFKIKLYERDVSMDLELRNELWKVMGEIGTIPPRLFIKGQYIGGADEVVALHEQGKLQKLLNGIKQVDEKIDQTCKNCFNVGFVLCSICNGSCKVLLVIDEPDEDLQFMTRCSYCNENGLVRCITCF